MATKNESGFFEDWPDWAKPAMALAVTVLLGGAWIGIPFLVAWRLMNQSAELGVVTYQPMMTVLVAMTTATIAGVFLFMTLRIDRGTRLKAESVAKRAAEDAMESEVERAQAQVEGLVEVAHGKIEKEVMLTRRHLGEIKEAAESLLDEIETRAKQIQSDAAETVGTFLREKFDEGTVPEEIRKEIAARLTKDVLRDHVEAVLTIDASIQAVGEYARQRARELDPATIKPLVALMEEAVRALRDVIQASQPTQRRGLLEAMKGFFGGFGRSSSDG